MFYLVTVFDVTGGKDPTALVEYVTSHFDAQNATQAVHFVLGRSGLLYPHRLASDVEIDIRVRMIG